MYVRAGVGFNCLLPLHTRRARAHHVPRGEALIQRSTYHSTTLHTLSLLHNIQNGPQEGAVNRMPSIIMYCKAAPISSSGSFQS